MRPPFRGRRGLRAALVTTFAAALVATAGCGPRADGVGPDDPTAMSAQIALAAHVAVASRTNAEPLRLQVATAYERTTGAVAPLGKVQAFPLGDARTQRVPLGLDLTPCLVDPAHRGAGEGTGRRAVCFVQFTITLLAGDRPLDTQTIGPVAVSPGRITPLDSITLYEVARVQVAPGTGSAPAAGTPVRVELGQSLPLTAVVLDAGGQSVTGRTVRWSSDAPAVARVDSLTGLVTPLAPGMAQLKASVGGRDGTVAVRVVPAPAPITLTGGAGTGSGRVRSSPEGVDCQFAAGVPSGRCTFTFPGDALVTLVATPDSNSAFGAWTGDCAAAAAAASCQLTPSSARTATVSFDRRQAALTLSLGGSGAGALTVTGEGVVGSRTCALAAGQGSATCTVPVAAGATVTLAASAGDGSGFAGWGAACAAAGTTPVCSLTVLETTAVTARFAPNTFVLSVSGSGPGSGDLLTPAPGINCQVRAGVAYGTCAASFPPQVVPLTASPDSASVLLSWTGDCAAQSPAVTTCAVSTTQARSVGVVFGRRQVTVTTSISGAAGQVTFDGSTVCVLSAGVDGVACPVRVDVYGLVTLRAVPAPSSLTKRLDGPCAGVPVDQPCLFRPTGDVTVPVTFVPAPVRVSVRPATGATGAGSVAVPELDLVCRLTGPSFGPAGQCDGTAAVGSRLTLTAEPGVGSSFRGWGGACAGQTGTTCTLTVAAAATATADFELTAGLPTARGETGTAALSVVTATPGIGRAPPARAVLVQALGRR